LTAPNHSNNGHVDLKARARLEMVEAGFTPEFEKPVVAEIKQLESEPPIAKPGSQRDLRSLLWSSIDNPESKDLDQLEYVERQPDGKARVMVAIADVDSFVPRGSACDQHAFHNTTSVYTGVATFPMLIDDLSFNLTSLIQDVDRSAIVIDLMIDQKGTLVSQNVYLALVRNRAKLDYPSIGLWFEKGGNPPDKVAAVQGLKEQLLLQNQVKEQIRTLRREQGSLHLQTTEAQTVAEDGKILDIEEIEENQARDLIENFMVSANIGISHFLDSKKIPSLRRVVKTPERWPKIVEVAASYGVELPAKPDAKSLSWFLLDRKDADPLRFPDLSLTIVKLLGRGEYTVEIPGQADAGHFALAVHDYTHATAPNRRYVDLATQRLVKSVLAGEKTPYTLEELNSVANQCTEREHAAKKVERIMRKVAAAVFLSKHIGESFEAIVTGVNEDGTYARLLKPPAEGKIVKGDRGLEVGDKVQLKLLTADPEQAFIDFAFLKKLGKAP
jgi:exoribonuclease-2